MCGIYGHLTTKKELYTHLYDEFMKTSHRGPDQSTFIQRSFEKMSMTLGFHWLKITGEGNQPFCKDGVYLICNGEIYNHKELIEKHSLTPSTTSDCEVILQLYLKNGIQNVLDEIDGVFAFALFDSNHNVIYLARDIYGVRPLFTGNSSGGEFGEFVFSSEGKSIERYNPQPFPPGHLQKISITDLGIFALETIPFFDVHSIESIKDDTSVIKKNLTESVIKRLQSEAKTGFLLSGGLDSSIVLSIACKYYFQHEHDDPIHVFSIGTKDNSPDVKSAKEVVEFLQNKYSELNLQHHIVDFNPHDGIHALPVVIYHLESYDTTTVRASTPMLLIAKYIAENTDVRVVMSGEGSDELFGGYLYFHSAPSDEEFENETRRLLSELYLYDNLRADRTMSAWGLELRVPFLDRKFTESVLSLKSSIKRPNGKDMEKQILRDCFKSDGSQKYLPDHLLYRQKEAFSDAVGMNFQNSVKTMAKILYPTEEKCSEREKFYYGNIYMMSLPNLLPHVMNTWLPKWIDTNGEPSATVLDVHLDNKN